MINKTIVILCIIIATVSCSTDKEKNSLPAHRDTPFIQDYSIKFLHGPGEIVWGKVFTDRNGYIQLFTSAGLLRLRNGQFLFPGTLVKDVQDQQTSDKKIAGLDLYQDQFVYIDDKAVFSNARAGKLLCRHTLPGVHLFAGGKDFTFLISDGQTLQLIRESAKLWEGSLPGDMVRDIVFEPENNQFWIMGGSSIFTFSPEDNGLKEVIRDENLTCIGLLPGRLVAGTSIGYYELDTQTKQKKGELQQKMPWTDLSAISEIDGRLWFGSTRGAMKLRDDGKFDYYASLRWLPSDSVIHISKGPENSVLVLTTKGLAQIIFKEMTLYDKAEFFERQVRERHIRLGFNATITGMTDGDVTTGSLADSDNDGLWTSMYLAGEALRYAVTKSDEALQNVAESLEAMERLYTINGLNSGFPSRSFERRGYKFQDPAWRRAEDPEWDWKSTTSSDEAIGHIFAFGVIAELVDEPAVRDKAVMLIDTLMSHIVKNDYYLIDWNGQPTLWGRWNPEYVNSLPVMVGDRKLNSSNITGMLQTAYHFTGKEKYKTVAFDLLNRHGYLENLMRPMREIAMAPPEASDYSRMLSEAWNHSDDEMYYCGYWGLYRYAFNDTLKAMFRETILDHFEAERPEKEGLWNIMTALTGTRSFDLEQAIWYLQEYPLDLVNRSVTNSHRKDLEWLEPNFRNQTISEVLPPDELRIARHNANRFDLDGNGEGTSEYSAGDIWLLPYWMGRYLGVISAPEK